MTEVVKSMKRYLFMERQADTLIISIFPRNDASRRVAIKTDSSLKLWNVNVVSPVVVK